MKILVVDDEEDVRVLLVLLLGSEGHEVATAENGREALEMLQQQPVALVITDVLMPLMDGFELCRLMKLDPLLNEIPIIFHTATYVDKSDEQLAMELGASGFLLKPSEPAALFKAIGLAMAQDVPRPSSDATDQIRVIEKHRDVLARKLEQKVSDLEAEKEALHINESKYRRLVESLEQEYFFYSHDGDGIFTYVSPSVLNVLGYSQKAFLVHYAQYLSDNPINEQAMQHTEAALLGKKQPAYELEIFDKQGQKHQLEIVETPIIGDANKVISVEGIAHDITERKKAERHLLGLNRALRTLLDTNQALVHLVDEQSFLNDVCRILIENGGYHMAWIGLAEQDEEKHVTPVAQAGYEEGRLGTLQSTWADSETGRGPVGTAIRTGKPVIQNDIHHDSNYAPWRQEAERCGYASSIALPFSCGKGFVYSLNIYSGRPNAFDEKELQLLLELSDDLAFGMKHNRLQQEEQKSNHRLEKALVQTVQAVAMTVEKRDPYTAGHQQRVSELAVAIAQEMGLGEQQIEGIRMGGAIHDIGKIYVPSEILNRLGKLTESEFNIIKTHPQVGYEIMKDVEFPWPVAEIIHQHHERLDGSGYPQGLKGDDITLEAKVLTVADVVEAITSHRPYRPGLGVEVALDEIEKNSGRLYAPQVVDACLRLFREKDYSLLPL